MWLVCLWYKCMTATTEQRNMIRLRMHSVKLRTWRFTEVTDRGGSLIILFLIMLTSVFRANSTNSAQKLIRVVWGRIHCSTSKMLSNHHTIPPTITVLDNNLQNNICHIGDEGKIYGITFIFIYAVINCNKEPVSLFMHLLSYIYFYVSIEATG